MATTEANYDRQISIQDITRLLNNMAFAEDVLDMDLFQSCWTSEQPIELDLTGHLSRYEKQHIASKDLADMVQRALSGFEGTQHALSNFMIDFNPSDENQAVARAYVTAYHYLQRDSTARETKAIMRGLWNVRVRKNLSLGKWEAIGIKVDRFVPIEGDETLYDEAKARHDQGKGRAVVS
ncbi:hypothetical protein PISL3812_03122 [Talaromyces islandicus]|uniref:SnoaL-like domain-containing protein n=1 Tax=Talaromyces islandicus TaxID=28573 RepID=A0A0U1LRU4_TALIS|nr:hypothetical protein PISL3812_03122 [Talaromyces islandicus]